MLELIPCREDDFDESIVDHVEERLSKNARMTVTTTERHGAALENVPHTSRSIMVRAAQSCHGPAFLVQCPPCCWYFSAGCCNVACQSPSVVKPTISGMRFPGLQSRYTSTLLASARKPAQPGESHAITRLRPLVPAIDLLPIKQGTVDEDTW